MDRVGIVLSALSDPTRRKILETVRKRPHSVSEIAKDFDVSRPAVSQHLRILQDAGLVICQPSGRQNFYGLDLRGLVALRAYVEGFWDDVLGAFQRAAIAEAKKKKSRGSDNA